MKQKFQWSVQLEVGCDILKSIVAERYLRLCYTYTAFAAIVKTFVVWYINEAMHIICICNVRSLIPVAISLSIPMLQALTHCTSPGMQRRNSIM